MTFSSVFSRISFNFRIDDSTYPKAVALHFKTYFNDSRGVVLNAKNSDWQTEEIYENTWQDDPRSSELLFDQGGLSKQINICLPSRRLLFYIRFYRWFDLHLHRRPQSSFSVLFQPPFAVQRYINVPGVGRLRKDHRINLPVQKLISRPFFSNIRTRVTRQLLEPQRFLFKNLPLL